MKRVQYLWMSMVLTGLVLPLISGCTGAPIPRAATQSSASSTSQSAGLRVENNGKFGEHTFTVAKDFESAGLVFTENTFTTTPSSIEGEIFTYHALLKEAQKLGADAIMNVVIDKKIIDREVSETSTSGQTTSSQRSRSSESIHEETWYGAALAIKYTTMLRTTSIVTTGTGAERTTTQSEQILFAGGGASGGTTTGGGGAQSESNQASSSQGGGGLFGPLLGGRR